MRSRVEFVPWSASWFKAGLLGLACLTASLGQSVTVDSGPVLTESVSDPLNGNSGTNCPFTAPAAASAFHANDPIMTVWVGLLGLTPQDSVLFSFSHNGASEPTLGWFYAAGDFQSGGNYLFCPSVGTASILGAWGQAFAALFPNGGGAGSWTLGIYLNGSSSPISVVPFTILGSVTVDSGPVLTESVSDPLSGDSGSNCPFTAPAASAFHAGDPIMTVWVGLLGLTPQDSVLFGFSYNGAAEPTLGWYYPTGAFPSGGNYLLCPSVGTASILGGWAQAFAALFPNGGGAGSWTLGIYLNGSASPISVVPFTILGNSNITGAITSVTTANGGAVIAQNTFIVIKGANLVPAGTPAGGTIWSSAPSFASGLMPTELGGVSVTVNNNPAFVYFYCSAATDPSCSQDQLNILTPLDNTVGSVPVVVTSGGVASPPFSVSMQAVAPSFLLFSQAGYIAATHLNSTLAGPASLYPGLSTPAAAGETIVLYAVGFGLPAAALVNGSASQSGPLPALPVCQVGGTPATVIYAGLASAGLYQLNLTIPAGAANGDNAVSCTYSGATTPAGDLIAVQSSTLNQTLTITTAGTGSGAVSASPAGTSCGSGCLSFAAGTVVTLTAAPNTGSTFTGWSGACSGTGSCTVTMKSNQAVTATFSASTAVQVSVSPAAATVETGASAQFTAAITGTNNAAVTWGVNNITGGNATVGTISTSGLYTAPSALPTPNTVTVAATSLADSSVSATASLAIQPACQIPAAAMTDATGSATICSGGFTFPVQLVDADAGSGITTGLAVAVAIDGNQPGRALLVVADPSGSYPLQFHSLASPSDPSETSAGSMVLRPRTSQAAAGSISVPIQAGEGDVATLVEAPIPTSILAHLPVPPPPPASTSDPYASNLVIRIGATLQNLSTGVNMRLPKLLQGVVSVSQSSPIQTDAYIGQLLGEVTNDTGEEVVGMLAEPVGEELGFEKGSVGTLLGNPEIDLVTTWIGLQAGYVNMAITNLCEDQGATEIVETRITVGLLKVAVPACYYPGPHVPVNVFPPKPNLTVNVTTSKGAPAGPDLLQFIKTDDLGVGFTAQTGSQGTAAIPVPAGSYSVRAGAVGFAPTTQTVSVPTGPSTLNLSVLPESTSVPLSFDVDALTPVTAGTPYTFSFCTPTPGPAGLCGFPQAKNPSGGQPPYHFQLGSGGFPPMGMSLSLNGLLTGTTTFTGTASFTVCAVDLSASSVCQPVSLTVNPASTSGGNLTGTWTGNVTQTGGGCNFSGTISLTLAETGATVTGSFTIAEPTLVSGDPDVCGTSINDTESVSGSLSGSTLSLTSTPYGGVISATVSGNTLTGTLTEGFTQISFPLLTKQ